MALIPLFEAKTYLRVDSGDEDALIGILQDILQGIAFFHANKAESFHKFAVIVFDD